MISKTIQLSDRRCLGYSDAGENGAPPFFYLPGGIGTRLQIQLQLADQMIRLISVDKPGLGLSGFKPGRKILDWPDDLLQLAEVLGFDRFGVLGVSSGGAYALACARQIPEHLTACGLVATATPLNFLGDEGKAMKSLLGLYQKFPGLVRAWLWWTYGRLAGKGEAAINKILARPARVPNTFAERDRLVWEDPEFRRHEWIDHLEAFRQGTRGPAYEMSLWGSDWGFDLKEITFEKIYVWHGELDRASPVAAVRRMLAVIPHQAAEIYPQEGHAVGTYHWEEILHVLAGAVPA